METDYSDGRLERVSKKTNIKGNLLGVKKQRTIRNTTNNFRPINLEFYMHGTFSLTNG